MYYYIPYKTAHKFNKIDFNTMHFISDEYIGWGRDGYELFLMYFKFVLGGRIVKNSFEKEFLQID